MSRVSRHPSGCMVARGEDVRRALGLMGDPPGVMDRESRDVTRRCYVLSRCLDPLAASSGLSAFAAGCYVQRSHSLTARVRCMELVSRVMRHPPEWIVARDDDLRRALGLMGDPPGVMDRESHDVTLRRGVLSRCLDPVAASTRLCALAANHDVERLHPVTARACAARELISRVMRGPRTHGRSSPSHGR